jgi:hypothetical protein
MLKTSYILSLRQLLKIAPELKKYLWQKLKPDKIYYVTIYNHTTIIQVQIGKNTIEDVFMDISYGVNIITK